MSHETRSDQSAATEDEPALQFFPRSLLVWKSLEERERLDEPALEHDHAADEPPYPWPEMDGPSRRDFLRFMAASLALGGASGCAYQPAESIVPYVLPPESVVAGKSMFFATAVPIDGFACGVLVKSQMGRPIKIEGNPAHPASLGATDAFGQASILTLYDPDRSQLVTHRGRADTWEHFQSFALDLRQSHKAKKGAGLRILTQTVASPTLADQIKRVLELFPEAKWHSYEPVTRDAMRAGCRHAFGEDLEPVYHLEKADVILSLDADFLAWGPGRLKDARAFAARREPAGAGAAATMNRLYVIEPTLTLTGAAADHRLADSAEAIAQYATRISALERALGDRPEKDRVHPWVTFPDAVVRDLLAHRGRCLVIAGDSQPPHVHTLAHLTNHALGNVGQTVEFFPRADAGPVDQLASLTELVRDISAGIVDTLIIVGGNPVYDAPADLDFARLLSSDQIKQKIHLGLYDDETAQHCHWHISQAHCLETWSDLRAVDGTATIVQPLIAPLYKGRSAHELFAVLLGQPELSGLEIVRDYWRRQNLPGDFESTWRGALETGVVAGTRSQPRAVTPREGAVENAKAGRAHVEPNPGPYEIVFRPDPTLWDGQYANNGWLQELPKPLTKLSWDNAALLSPATAQTLGVENEDVVELRLQGKSVLIPVWILPGQADQSVTVYLGHGRRRAGRVGTGVGVDVYGLRTSNGLWFSHGLEIVKTSERRRLAAMHHHFSMEGRDLIRGGTLEEYKKDPAFARGLHDAHADSLIPEPAPQAAHEHGEGYAWGMAININTCIGCGACVAACQAENNIPIVGREQVLASREMHWLRIDRYFEGEDTANPAVDFQPVPCMHCEKAPCEIVCPVGATTHSAEGLNEMTYNRCVGTRYCSNNCPYKVRRFNFFAYNDDTSPTLKLMRNPDVTVRSRGVMEKCTYCVQRINGARINAEMENRTLGGDEVVTACQAACPTQAMVFGNLNDRNSAVSRAKASPRNYALLAELNTRPRTTYLAKLRNSNPEFEALARDGTRRS
jgi:Fe-S-cluster-containing dehydrogenase component